MVPGAQSTFASAPATVVEHSELEKSFVLAPIPAAKIEQPHVRHEVEITAYNLEEASEDYVLDIFKQAGNAVRLPIWNRTLTLRPRWVTVLILMRA